MEFKPEETLKKLAKDVTDAAQPYIDKVEPVAKDLRDKAYPVAQDLLGKAEPVLNLVKEKAAPVTETATRAAKSVGGGITKTASKVTCKEEVYVQYNNHEVRTTDIMDAAKDDYIKKGHKLTDIKEIQVYIKTTDNSAYYVINHNEAGKIEF